MKKLFLIFTFILPLSNANALFGLGNWWKNLNEEKNYQRHQTLEKAKNSHEERVVFEEKVKKEISFMPDPTQSFDDIERQKKEMSQKNSSFLKYSEKKDLFKELPVEEKAKIIKKVLYIGLIHSAEELRKYNFKKETKKELSEDGKIVFNNIEFSKYILKRLMLLPEKERNQIFQELEKDSFLKPFIPELKAGFEKNKLTTKDKLGITLYQLLKKTPLIGGTFKQYKKHLEKVKAQGGYAQFIENYNRNMENSNLFKKEQAEGSNQETEDVHPVTVFMSELTKGFGKQYKLDPEKSGKAIETFGNGLFNPSDKNNRPFKEKVFLESYLSMPDSYDVNKKFASSLYKSTGTMTRKFLQGVLEYLDETPIKDALQSVKTNVPADSEEKALKELEQSYLTKQYHVTYKGKKLNEDSGERAILNIDELVGGASVAHVYKGHLLENGKKMAVVIKLRRPESVEKFLLEKKAYLESSKNTPMYDPLKMLSESIEHEFNLDSEYENAKKAKEIFERDIAYEALKENPHQFSFVQENNRLKVITVPERNEAIVRNLPISPKNVLLMEVAEGENIKRLNMKSQQKIEEIAGMEEGPKKEKALKQLKSELMIRYVALTHLKTRSMLTAFFDKSGIFHDDLHGGNIYFKIEDEKLDYSKILEEFNAVTTQNVYGHFSPNYKLTLIDIGLGKFSKKEQETFIILSTAMACNNYHKFYDVLAQDFGLKSDKDETISEMEEALEGKERLDPNAKMNIIFRMLKEKFDFLLSPTSVIYNKSIEALNSEIYTVSTLLGKLDPSLKRETQEIENKILYTSMKINSDRLFDEPTPAISHLLAKNFPETTGIGLRKEICQEYLFKNKSQGAKEALSYVFQGLKSVARNFSSFYCGNNG